jgi:hypothetical protein
MSETITWNNAHGFDCSSCGHTQEPCEHWKLFVNEQASASPQATGGLRELVVKWRKQRPEGSMSWDCAAELEAVLAQSQVPANWKPAICPKCGTEINNRVIICPNPICSHIFDNPNVPADPAPAGLGTEHK